MRALRSHLMLFGVAWCGCAEPASTIGVIARLADSTLEARPPQTHTRLRLAGASRPATCAPVPGRFEVDLPDGATGLRYSVGTRDTARPIRFRVHRRDGAGAGSWREIASHVVAPGEAGWQSASVSLTAAGRAAGPLRFETAPAAAEPDRPGAASGEACWASVRVEAPDRRESTAPHILLLSLDTLGATHLGSFEGVPGVSPRIDAFLEESFQFRRAFAPFGNTIVSHSSLFSGLAPVRHRRYTLPRPGEPKGMPPLRSFVEDLAAEGYATAAFTEDGFVGSPFGFGAGFDLYHDGRLDVDDDAAATLAAAEAWLDALGPQRRFFLFLHTYEVHTPYRPADAASRAFADRLTPNDARGFDDFEYLALKWRQLAGRSEISARDASRLRALYAGEIRYLDRVLGEFLERFDSREWTDEPLVVLTSDHGDLFGEDGRIGHGTSLHNHVMHVPLAFRWRGRIEPGESDAPVQLVDVMPTLFSLVQLPVPDGSDGHDLTPAWSRGSSGPVGGAAFSEERRTPKGCRPLPRKPCYIERYSVQTGRFKLVRDRDGRGERLYDLERDPDETLDVAGEHPEVLARHRALLDGYLAGDDVGVDEGASDPELDDATRDRLRELGYIE